MPKNRILTSTIIDTPLGNMIAISDEQALHFLQFADHRNLQKDINRLQRKTSSNIVAGITVPLISIKHELEEYFYGKLKEFKTPVSLSGSPFQKKTWQALRHIAYAQTKSYKELALAVQNAKAYRAVGNANGKNPLVIVIPCHRIISANGKLGGYSAGIERKKWLLEHEMKHRHLLS